MGKGAAIGVALFPSQEHCTHSLFQYGCRSLSFRLVNLNGLLELPMKVTALTLPFFIQVYARMSEVLGITGDNHVLETFMTKM